VILGDNPLIAEPDAIGSIPVLGTIVGGELVHERSMTA
jgi:hypothetical protein